MLHKLSLDANIIFASIGIGVYKYIFILPEYHTRDIELCNSIYMVRLTKLRCSVFVVNHWCAILYCS